MNWKSDDEVQEFVRERVSGYLLKALTAGQLNGDRHIPKRYFAAANAGAVWGVADALANLISVASTKPDYTAEIVADHIRSDVAFRTSGGAA